jgi:hypothetical protein
LLDITKDILGAIVIHELSPPKNVCVRYTDLNEEWLNEFFIEKIDIQDLKDIIINGVENITLVDNTSKSITLKNGIPKLLIKLNNKELRGIEKTKISITIQPKRRFQ